MSDSEHSTVTYTSISNDYEEPSDVGFLGVMVYGYDELPMHLPSLDYVPGPEHPPSPVYVPYVSEPAYPEFMPPEDDVFLAEEQPLPAAVSPDDDDEEESFRDDADDEEEGEGEDKEVEEEEHLALADSVLPLAYRTTARMSIRAQTPIPFPSEVKVDILLAIPTSPPSPLTSLSSPLPQIPSPPFPIPSPLTTSPTNTVAPLGYRAVGIRLRNALPPPLPLSSPLPLPPPIILTRTRASMVLMRAVAPSTYILAPRSKTPPSGIPPSGTLPLLPIITYYGFFALCMLEIRRDLDREIGYGIIDVWEDPNEIAKEIPKTDVAELGQRMTNFVTTIRQDTDEIYIRLDDAQDDRSLMSGQLNLLCRDRRSHARTTRLIESEARASLEAWVQSIDASDMTRSEVRALRTTVLAHQTEIRDLRAADCRRQAQLVEALTLMSTLQTQMVALQRQQRPARDPAHPDVPEEVGKNASKESTQNQNHPATATTLITDAAIRALKSRGVADAFAEQEIQRNNNLNGDGSQGSGSGITRPVRPTREMETVFNISNCAVENQVKFATCTLHGVALTWWKYHVKTVGHDAAHGELKVKGTKLASYTQRFQELALLCGRMFLEESDKIEKAVEFATELMDKKIHTFDERRTENKSKFEDTSRNNQNQQQQNKRQNTDRAYTAGSVAPKCHKCNRVGHLARDCRTPANANTTYNQRGTGAGQKDTCFECGAQGNFKRECPKLKNNNRGNQGRNDNASAKVYVVGNAGTNTDTNIITGTFLLNNRYAYILFDIGADKSFVSTAFSSQIDITPTTLEYYYDVELADGNIVRINTIIRGCTLNFLNHPFNINLILVKLGSFNIIIRMDWLEKYQAVIVCAEKIVRIPWGNETLIVHDDGND
ncbi:reverse transcriptase domain-containing protein [Tanacetum coccineum]